MTIFQKREKKRIILSELSENILDKTIQSIVLKTIKEYPELKEEKNDLVFDEITSFQARDEIFKDNWLLLKKKILKYWYQNLKLLPEKSEKDFGEELKQYYPLYRGLRFLIDNDPDYAKYINSIGFRRGDSFVGRDIERIPFEKWDDVILYKTWELLRTYKNTQLPIIGIDFDEIPIPPKPEKTDEEIKQKVKEKSTILDRKISVGENKKYKQLGFIVSWPRNDEIKESFDRIIPFNKRLKKFKIFLRDSKAWFVSFESKKELEKFAEKWDFTWSDEAKNIEIEEKEYKPEYEGKVFVFEDNYHNKNIMFKWEGFIPGLADVFKGEKEEGNLKNKYKFDFKARESLISLVQPNLYDNYIDVQALARIARELKFSGLETLDELEAELEPLAEIYREKHLEQQEAEERREKTPPDTLYEMSFATDGDLDDKRLEGLTGDLMGFQRGGVAYIDKTRRAFIADQQGLGKTIQGIASVHYLRAYPAIFIIPSVVKYNWFAEIKKWLPDKRVVVIEGKTGITKAKKEELEAQGAKIILAGKTKLKKEQIETLVDTDIILVNYELVGYHVMSLLKATPQAVVFDESHYLKTYDTLRTKSSRKLAYYAPVRILLTGTPSKNRPVELYPQLQVIGRLDDMGGFNHFMSFYVNRQKTRWGTWDVSGAQNLDTLNEELRKKCYIRREKSQVLKQLPPKQRIGVPVDIINREKYNEIADDPLKWFGEKYGYESEEYLHLANVFEVNPGAEALLEIGPLRQLVGEGKIGVIDKTGNIKKAGPMVQWIDDFLESGEKIVIFAWFRRVVEALGKYYAKKQGRKWRDIVVDGATSPIKRQEMTELFQTDPSFNVIVLNIAAGGVGITLTDAWNLAFAEYPWTPGDLEQAEDRIHRISQDLAVNIWYFIGNNTIDETMLSMLARKWKITKEISTGEENEKIKPEKFYLEGGNRIYSSEYEEGYEVIYGDQPPPISPSAIVRQLNPQVNDKRSGDRISNPSVAMGLKEALQVGIMDGHFWLLG